MSHETEFALYQAEVDLLRAQDQDRYLIMAAERRIKGRSRLIKLLRHHFRRRGLVNVSGDSDNPQWMRKDYLR